MKQNFLYFSAVLIKLALCLISVLHAQVYDIHSEPDEAGKTFCIPRRSHHIGTGKYELPHLEHRYMSSGFPDFCQLGDKDFLFNFAPLLT